MTNYTTYVNCYEVEIRHFYRTEQGANMCTVYVPELSIYDNIPQSMIEIKEVQTA